MEMPERWVDLLILSIKLLAILTVAVFVRYVLLKLHRRYIVASPSLKTYSGITRVLLTVGLYAVFLLILLDTAGISITPLVASLGVGGIAVALALQDTLSNFFSGVYVVVDQPIRVGDYVRLDSGQEGTIDSIGWRSVRIQTLQNHTVIIPNAKLAGSILTNYDLPTKDLAVLVQVGVDYASDLGQVERVSAEVARDVMKTVTGGVPAFEPFVRFHTFGDSSVNFTVIMRGKAFVDQYLIKHEFVKRLHERFKKEGIVIPFPVRTVHIRQEK